MNQPMNKTGMYVAFAFASASTLWSCGDDVQVNSGNGGGGTGGAVVNGGTAGLGGGGGSDGGTQSSAGTGGLAGGGGSSQSSGGTDPGTSGAPSGGQAGGANNPPEPGPSCTGDQGATTAECETLLVEGGSFARGYDGAYGLDDTRVATVSDFYLDKYEVTVGRFRAFLGAGWSTQDNAPPAGAGAHPKISDSGWKASWSLQLPADTAAAVTARACDAASPYRADMGLELYPIACVNWYEAFAFCAWDGGRLPTEAEWHYAGSGGSEQRVYPWSDPPNSAQILDVDAVYNLNVTSCCSDVPRFLGVGSKPAGIGKWGHLDMGGNLTEWVLDWYGDDYPSPCDDCANLANPGQRVVKGGAWNESAAEVANVSRVQQVPGTRDLRTGFRCARD